MAKYIKSDEFLEIAKECQYSASKIQEAYPTQFPNLTTLRNRMARYRRKGLMPLDSGNIVSTGETLIGTTTLYDAHGAIKSQYVKTNVAKEQQIAAVQDTIIAIATDNPIKVPKVKSLSKDFQKDLATVYISNDIHFGLLTWESETGVDWSTKDAVKTMQDSYDYLFDASPNSKVGIVVDLGDMTEADNFSNVTPKSGNPLDTDSRYPKVLRAAYESLMYAINKALQKHEVVYFYNIAGNHDMVTAVAVREVIRVAYANNNRVIVDDTSSPIKYHHHNEVLIGFAHGDGLRMPAAGETMAADCESIFSHTKHRFMHFGHTHKDAVHDGRLCRSESHRNIAPLNAWANHMGYRRGGGTMKSITYHKKDGEISRNTFNVK